jgi:hypothetical protein
MITEYRLYLVGLLAFVALTPRVLPQATSAPQKQAEVSEADLAAQLMGTWIFEENLEYAGKVGPGLGRLQFFTGKHWTMTQPDPKTGEVIWHHGGTYTLKGNELTKTVLYAADTTRRYIGTTRRFRIKIEGDRLIQVAMDGNPFTEVWKRAK